MLKARKMLLAVGLFASVLLVAGCSQGGTGSGTGTGNGNGDGSGSGKQETIVQVNETVTAGAIEYKVTKVTDLGKTLPTVDKLTPAETCTATKGRYIEFVVEAKNVGSEDLDTFVDIGGSNILDGNKELIDAPMPSFLCDADLVKEPDTDTLKPGETYKFSRIVDVTDQNSDFFVDVTESVTLSEKEKPTYISLKAGLE